MKKKKERRVSSHSVKALIWTYRPGISVGKESACSAGDPSSIPGSRRSPGEEIGYPLQYSRASLVSQLVKNLPAMWETWVWSLGWEDSLEKGMSTHSSILPGEVHGLYDTWGCKELDTTEWVSLTHSTWIVSYMKPWRQCVLVGQKLLKTAVLHALLSKFNISWTPYERRQAGRLGIPKQRK